MTPHAARNGRRLGAFTLLEMMAVVFLTAVVLAAAVDFYLDLSRAGQQAVDATRSARRAASLLDRLARDLQGAVLLVKPPELDPLLHPWLFVAEADHEGDGARRLKFVTRSHRPRSSAEHESDLAVVALVAEEDTELGQGLLLLRSLSPGLPEELDRSFPRQEGDGTQLLADGLARFGMRFLSEEGQWTARFDSSTLEQSGQLPRAVEIELAFLEDTGEEELAEGGSYVRRVLLPLRPLDLEEEQEEQEEEQSRLDDCVTVSQCLGLHPTLLAQPDRVDLEGLAEHAESCARDVADLFGVLPEDCN